MNYFVTQVVSDMLLRRSFVVVDPVEARIAAAAAAAAV